MRFRSALLLLSLLPLPLFAQGMGMGRGMGGGPGAGAGFQRNVLPKFATAKELEKFNAAEALLQDTRKLKLSEPQVAQLTTMRAQLYEQNASLLVRYDSVRRNYRPPAALTGQGNGANGVPPTQEEMVLLGDQMRAMMEIGDLLMAQRQTQVTAALALMDDSQRDRARKVLDDQTNDVRKAVPPLPPRDARRGAERGGPERRP